MFGPRIQGSAERRHPKSKDFDFGRTVNVRGLLSRQEVGVSAALFGALRGWNSSSWNFKIVLDDEFWYVTVTPALSRSAPRMPLDLLPRPTVPGSLLCWGFYASQSAFCAGSTAVALVTFARDSASVGVLDVVDVTLASCC